MEGGEQEHRQKGEPFHSRMSKCKLHSSEREREREEEKKSMLRKEEMTMAIYACLLTIKHWDLM